MQHEPYATCDRCGRQEPLRKSTDGTHWLPENWEGSIGGQHPATTPVCPGCQYVEWHPHCMSLLAWDTDEVVVPEIDWAGMPPEERDYDSVRFCEHIDLTVSHVEGEGEWPEQWTCPRCGTEHRHVEEGQRETFEWVHRDYLAGGLEAALRRGDVTVTIEEADDDES